MAAHHVVQTPLVRLEPFSAIHLTPTYVAWLNDPEVVRFSDQRFREHTIESCRGYVESFVGSPNAFWAILRRADTPAHVGTVSMYLDPHHGVADFGIMVGDRGAWGTGVGYDAWRGLCEYAFREIEVRKVTAGTLSVNASMLRIMEKAGMVPDGVRQKHCLFEGAEVEVVHAALFASDWRPQADVEIIALTGT